MPFPVIALGAALFAAGTAIYKGLQYACDSVIEDKINESKVEVTEKIKKNLNYTASQAFKRYTFYICLFIVFTPLQLFFNLFTNSDFFIATAVCIFLIFSAYSICKGLCKYFNCAYVLNINIIHPIQIFKKYVYEEVRKEFYWRTSSFERTAISISSYDNDSNIINIVAKIRKEHVKIILLRLTVIASLFIAYYLIRGWFFSLCFGIQFNGFFDPLLYCVQYIFSDIFRIIFFFIIAAAIIIPLRHILYDLYVHDEKI